LAVRAKRRGAKQKLREFAALLRILTALEPRYILEIGSLHGGTLWAWTRVATSDAVLVSVDLPGGAYGGGYAPERAPEIESYTRLQQEMRLIQADSHDPETVQRVADALSGASLDFLFIDGDHTYGGVRADYEMYGELVRPGGLIAFHDIVPQPDCGVDRLWADLLGSKRELVDESDLGWRGQWGGIGLLTTASE
jgi:cephalosporin hydroxylase